MKNLKSDLFFFKVTKSQPKSSKVNQSHLNSVEVRFLNLSCPLVPMILTFMSQNMQNLEMLSYLKQEEKSYKS